MRAGIKYFFLHLQLGQRRATLSADEFPANPVTRIAARLKNCHGNPLLAEADTQGQSG
jgi:hypothetical protein